MIKNFHFSASDRLKASDNVDYRILFMRNNSMTTVNSVSLVSLCWHAVSEEINIREGNRVRDVCKVIQVRMGLL